MASAHINDLENRTRALIQMYEFLVDQLDEGIHVVDASGKTVIYNQKMADIESMSAVDVLNKDVLDVFTFPEEGYSTLLHALQTGRATFNVKQTYYNLQGESVTTINNTMPIVLNGEICGAVEIARDITQIERIQENILRRGKTRYTFDSLIGESPNIVEVMEHAKRAARTNSSILIVGETGTGKELFAQSIHHASPRSAGPFVSQNCAALPEHLIEGILFGTVHGAFPGAIDRPGLLEQADGGTLLLDELNSLSLPLQAKLLRALQEKTIRRLGDTRDRTVDVRIIATVHEDPLDDVVKGTLRKDLYYRLSVVTLFLPPLRERQQDIPNLTALFVQRYNELFGMQVQGVSDEVMKYFLTYPWPGNVRELENTIEGAMNMVVDNGEIDVVHLPMHIRRRVNALDETPHGDNSSQLLDYASFAQERNLQSQLSQYERAYVLKVLSQNGGNVSATARALGVSRQSLQYRLRKWNHTT
ncbi:arginine utilization regulatory protein RocR [Alicyclobacillus acidoterrestris]|nr:arginine utilization regulatory protein RocR [Alicyclobacillus acidoterrestris]